MILYFLHSEIKEDQKTRKAVTMLIDPKLQLWYSEAEVEFNALPFETFVKEVYIAALPTGWETKQYHKMLCLYQNGCPF